MGRLQCHLHRPQQICREESPLPKKWLTLTDSANGPKVLLVTISKVGCNFWLVVIGMSLCRGRVPHGAKQIWCRKWCRWPWPSARQEPRRPLPLELKNGLVGLKIRVQKKCWCKHALQSQWGDSPRFTPTSLLRINMQAPGSSAAKGEADQWGSSQTCRDRGSVRAGQVTCLEGHHKHIGMGVGYLFPLIFQKYRRKKWSRTT